MSLITEEQVVLDLTGADRHEATGGSASASSPRAAAPTSTRSWTTCASARRPWRPGCPAASASRTPAAPPSPSRRSSSAVPPTGSTGAPRTARHPDLPHRGARGWRRRAHADAAQARPRSHEEGLQGRSRRRDHRGRGRPDRQQRGRTRPAGRRAVPTGTSDVDRTGAAAAPAPSAASTSSVSRPARLASPTPTCGRGPGERREGRGPQR